MQICLFLKIKLNFLGGRIECFMCNWAFFGGWDDEAAITMSTMIGNCGLLICVNTV